MRERWVRVIAWFLALSYGLGAPVTAFSEFRNQTLSERFDLPPALIYVTCIVQVASAAGVLSRRYAVLSAATLTVTTLGAIVCHIRVGKPETAVAAVVYTVIQVWFGLLSRREIRAA